MQDIKTQQDNRERRLVELYESFSLITDKIERKLQEKQSAEYQRQAYQDAMLAIERQVENDILWAVTAVEVPGKKDEPARTEMKQTFTNQAQRDNEKFTRLLNAEAYQALKASFEEQTQKLDNARIDLEILDKRFRARQTQAQMEALLPHYFTVTAQPQLQSSGNAQTENL